MEKVLIKIKHLTILLYITVGLSGLNSLWFEKITSDFAHEIFSLYFFMETIILASMIILGLKNKWTRLLIGFLTLTETILFFLDKPISPDELLMVIIFGLRVYILIELFSKTVNQYYAHTD